MYLGALSAELRFKPSKCGGRLYTSETDVCRRQILMYKDGPRTESFKTFMIAVDP